MRERKGGRDEGGKRERERETQLIHFTMREGNVNNLFCVWIEIEMNARSDPGITNEAMLFLHSLNKADDPSHFLLPFSDWGITCILCGL